MSAGRIALVVNPTAGKGRGLQIGRAAQAKLTNDGYDVVAAWGDTAAGTTQQLQLAVKEGVDAVFAVGGDGLANLAVDVIAGTSIPFGLVPAGTGNDLGTALGIPTSDPAAAVAMAVEALRQGRTRPIDAVKVVGEQTDRWFACVLGAGFDSVVNERANELRWPKGPQRYNLAIALELPRFQPMDFRITIDGVSHDGPAILVALGNARSYGGGIKITPNAELDDGLIDVCILHPVSKLEMVRTLPKARTGDHVKHPQVQLLRGREVRLECDHVIAYADGERFGPLPITCTAMSGALRLLCT